MAAPACRQDRDFRYREPEAAAAAQRRIVLVTITCDLKVPYRQFFQSLFERPNAIPVIEAILGTKLTQGNSTEVFTDELLAALTDAYREAAANPGIQIIEVRERKQISRIRPRS
jgi:hypothetical protein